MRRTSNSRVFEKSSVLSSWISSSLRLPSRRNMIPDQSADDLKLKFSGVPLTRHRTRDIAFALETTFKSCRPGSEFFWVFRMTKHPGLNFQEQGDYRFKPPRIREELPQSWRGLLTWSLISFDSISPALHAAYWSMWLPLSETKIAQTSMNSVGESKNDARGKANEKCHSASSFWE